MRQLAHLLLSENDPLSGRAWEGWLHGEKVEIDNEVFIFYRYSERFDKVELEEPDTRLLWWYYVPYFLAKAKHVDPSNVSFWTEKTDGTVESRRQLARYKYMLSIQSQGELKPSELSTMANRWWPGTEVTDIERED